MSQLNELLDKRENIVAELRKLDYEIDKASLKDIEGRCFMIKTEESVIYNRVLPNTTPDTTEITIRQLQWFDKRQKVTITHIKSEVGYPYKPDLGEEITFEEYTTAINDILTHTVG